MEPKFFLLFPIALIPMIVGFIYYNPNVLGNAWMKASGMTPEKAQSGNMPLTFGLSYLLSLFLTFALFGMVVHQAGIYSLFSTQPGFGEAGSDIQTLFEDIMAQVGTYHRSFGHGVLHGVFAGFTVALPILGTNALFEQRGFKYIAINLGYWIITLALMGGVICQFV